MRLRNKHLFSAIAFIRLSDTVGSALTAVDELGDADLEDVDISNRKPLLAHLKQAQSKLDAHIGRATHAGRWFSPSSSDRSVG